MRINHLKRQILLLIFIILGFQAYAVELKVAVASNFQLPAEQIKRLFESETLQKLSLIGGSSGKHFAQITNGAPFDVFLAADSNYIDKLEVLRLTETGSRWQYARGKLVLVVKTDKKSEVIEIKKLFAENKLFTSPEFKKLKFAHLAIANPDIAPYGRAAKEMLDKLGIFQDLKAKLVVGENIQQTQQFVETGNAELGLLSLAQVISSQDLYFMVPDNLYAPIIQEAVVLKTGSQINLNKKVAIAFIEFLKTPKIKKLIQSFGYETL